MYAINPSNLVGKPSLSEPKIRQKNIANKSPAISHVDTDLRNIPCYKPSFSGLNHLKLMKENPFTFVFAELNQLNLAKYDNISEIKKMAEESLNELLDMNQYEITNPQYSKYNGKRMWILKNWKKHFSEKLAKEDPAKACVILSSIVKSLRPENSKMPPIFDKNILLKTETDFAESIKEKGKLCFSFLKNYELNLSQRLSQKDLSAILTKKEDGWIRVPSKINDPENYEQNVKLVETLAPSNWCTANGTAPKMLLKNDWQVFIKNGRVELVLQSKNGKINQIRGIKNDNKIPCEYLEIIRDYKDKNNLSYTDEMGTCIKNAENSQNILLKTQIDLAKEIKNKDFERILNHFGVKTNKLENGNLKISEYRQPNECFSFKDLGIDEDEMFSNLRIQEIEGNADFRESKIKDLRILNKICGSALFAQSEIEKLSELTFIGGNAKFSASKITNLNKLKIINGGASLQNTSVTDLGQLEEIGGAANFIGCKIISIENLKKIGKNLHIDKNSQHLDFSTVKIGGKIHQIE